MDKITLKIGDNDQQVETSAVSEALKGLGYTVLSNDEFNAKFGSFHAEYENAFTEATGIKKPDGMKGTDFIKQQAKALFDKTGSFEAEKNALSSEIAELKEKIKKGVGNDDLKAENERILAELQTRKEEIENIKAGHQKELSTMQSKNAVSRLLDEASRTIKKETDPNAIAFLRSEISGISLQHGIKKNEEGQHIVLNEHGTALTDKNHSVITVEKLIEEKFKPYQTDDKSGAGTGGKGGSGSGGGSDSLPDSVTTLLELTEYMKENKIVATSETGIKLQLLARKKRLPFR